MSMAPVEIMFESAANGLPACSLEFLLNGAREPFRCKHILNGVTIEVIPIMTPSMEEVEEGREEDGQIQSNGALVHDSRVVWCSRLLSTYLSPAASLIWSLPGKCHVEPSKGHLVYTS